MAVFDWVATGLTAYALGRMFDVPVAMSFALLLLTAIILHVGLGVPTRLNAYLGLAKKDDVYAARTKAAAPK
jgi:hypothetical protein